MKDQTNTERLVSNGFIAYDEQLVTESPHNFYEEFSKQSAYDGNCLSTAKPSVDLFPETLERKNDTTQLSNLLNSIIPENKIALISELNGSISNINEPSAVMQYIQEKLEGIPETERRKWVMEQVRDIYGEVLPESLLELTAASFFDGDSGVGIDTRPKWLDIEKFRKGQKFALDHLFQISYANLLSLFTVFSFEDGLRPLILTGASSTPYTSFKRYLSTLIRVRNWYNHDPWTAGSAAYTDARAVRKMHAMVRKRLSGTSTDELLRLTRIEQPWCPALEAVRGDFQAGCPEPRIGQCSYSLLGQRPELKLKHLNQGEMVATQFAFVGLAVTYPEVFGMQDAKDEELEAFCYVWRGIGYLLGIEDEFNLCRGTLEDVRQRTKDILQYWVKPNFRTATPEAEHMIRCVIEGMQYYCPGSTFNFCMIDLARILDVDMPRLYDQMSYFERMFYKMSRFYFDYACRLSTIRHLSNFALNRAVDKAKNYDENVHKKLQKKSDKVLKAYTAKSTQNNEVTEKYSKNDFLP